MKQKISIGHRSRFRDRGVWILVGVRKLTFLGAKFIVRLTKVINCFRRCVSMISFLVIRCNNYRFTINFQIILNSRTEYQFVRAPKNGKFLYSSWAIFSKNWIVIQSKLRKLVIFILIWLITEWKCSINCSYSYTKIPPQHTAIFTCLKTKATSRNNEKMASDSMRCFQWVRMPLITFMEQTLFKSMSIVIFLC